MKQPKDVIEGPWYLIYPASKKSGWILDSSNIKKIRHLPEVWLNDALQNYFKIGPRRRA